MGGVRTLAVVPAGHPRPSPGCIRRLVPGNARLAWHDVVRLRGGARLRARTRVHKRATMDRVRSFDPAPPANPPGSSRGLRRRVPRARRLARALRRPFPRCRSASRATRGFYPERRRATRVAIRTRGRRSYSQRTIENFIDEGLPTVAQRRLLRVDVEPADEWIRTLKARRQRGHDDIEDHARRDARRRRSMPSRRGA